MSNERTWTVKINEGELKALIQHNACIVLNNPTPDASARIHDLTKRLNKDTPEIEKNETEPQTQQQAQAANTSSW